MKKLDYQLFNTSKFLYVDIKVYLLKRFGLKVSRSRDVDT